MAITTQWDNAEKTVIRYIYEGQWTWDELYAAMHEAYKMVDSVKHEVDVIIDMRKSGVLPANVFTHSRQATLSQHPRLARTVIVGAHRLAHTMFEAFTKIYGKLAKRYSNVIFVATIEEAYAHLNKATAPNSTPK
jgi:hypothetical protein